MTQIKLQERLQDLIRHDRSRAKAAMQADHPDMENYHIGRADAFQSALEKATSE